MSSWAAIRRHHLFIQFVKYCVGGGVFFWSGYATFAICYSGFGLDWLPAKLIGDVVGLSANYLVQRYWAFADSRLKNVDRQVRRRYLLISATNFILDFGLIGGLKHLGITPYVGFFISAGFFTGWNYIWYRFYVFVPPKASHRPALTED